MPPDPLAQICTKSFVGWGFASDPTGGAYSAPPDPLAGLRGPTSKGRGGRGPTSKGGEVRRGRGGDGRESREKEGERGRGERREEVDGWTNPKPAATGLFMSYSTELHTPSSPGGLPTMCLTTKGSYLPWGRVVKPLVSPLMPDIV